MDVANTVNKNFVSFYQKKVIIFQIAQFEIIHSYCGSFYKWGRFLSHNEKTSVECICDGMRGHIHPEP